MGDDDDDGDNNDNDDDDVKLTRRVEPSGIEPSRELPVTANDSFITKLVHITRMYNHADTSTKRNTSEKHSVDLMNSPTFQDRAISRTENAFQNEQPEMSGSSGDRLLFMLS
ncbi:unnamed protein product [Brugia pahangi]|uniref:Uncharacterized protein n=1 Tax=Brugia pahangi TaxID=6280 RepID=A0A0N4TPE1_BRUPA|nr:unnamed protein product [Brugia pahangi]